MKIASFACDRATRIENVTGFWKTLRMGFFVKMEFDVSLISPTLELTHLQVEADRALRIARFVCDRTTTIRNEK